MFVSQPSNTAAGAVISPAVTVRVEDADGNTVTSSTAAVTMALGNNPGGGTLAGTLTVKALNGVATFSNLVVNKSGRGYTLVAKSGRLADAVSEAFDIL